MDQQTKRNWVERLYADHATEVFRLALVILRDQTRAEDVLQETFLKVQQTRALPGAGKERAWLMAIARNATYDALRRDSREVPTEDAVLQLHAPEISWEYTDLLEGLSVLERDIVSLHIIGGLTHKEIARMLGMSVHGEKKRYERALEKLRRDMEEEL